jgi:hypothetical protein
VEKLDCLARYKKKPASLLNVLQKFSYSDIKNVIEAPYAKPRDAMKAIERQLGYKRTP